MTIAFVLPSRKYHSSNFEFKSLFTVMAEPKLGKKETKPDLAVTFKKLDTNGDGSLSLEEFKGVSTAFPAKQPKKQAAGTDTSKARIETTTAMIRLTPTAADTPESGEKT